MSAENPKSADGVTWTDTKPYRHRLERIQERKSGADGDLRMLERELGQELEAFQRIQRDPDHQRLYRAFFSALEQRVRESGVDMETAIRTLLAPPETVPAPARLEFATPDFHLPGCRLDRDHVGKCGPAPEEPRIRAFARWLDGVLQTARAGLDDRDFQGLLDIIADQGRSMLPPAAPEPKP